MISTKTNLSFSADWIQQIPTAIALIDNNYNLVSASPNWFKKFDFQENDLTGRHLFDLFPRFSKDWDTKLKYCIDGLKDIKIIDNQSNSKSSENNLVWDLNPWKDGYGNIIGVILKVDNISKSRKLELELKRTKLILNQKGKIAKIGSWEYLINEEQLQWSPIVHSIYGVSNDFKPSLDGALAFYKEGTSRDTIKQKVKEAIITGKPWNENLQLMRGDGSTIWVNSIGRPKYKDGICVRVIGTVQDITATYEQSLNRLERHQNTFFDQVAFGLILSDFNTGKIIAANEAFAKLAGYETDYFKGKTFKGFISESLKKSSINLAKQLKKKGAFTPVETVFYNKDGKKLTLRLSGKRIETFSGGFNVLTTIENLTPVIEKEKRIKKLLKDATQKNERLLNFAHMVSHNLKAHTTNFSLLLNFLDKEVGESERKKLMEMLFNASDNLSETIKGLREVVAIKTNANKEKKDISLNEHLFHVEQNLMGLLKQNNGKIINEIPDSVKVKALPAYLDSILTNCLTNAIKYSKPDKAPIIILSVQKTKAYTTLSIEDNGMGIDMEKFGDKLFGLYQTFHKENNGNGIGLYITKQQIESMNGKIDALSTSGQGTTFRISFSNS
ncbi:PAS domain S-box protein [Maribacter sp. R77961]|uniref:PAS domain S-box protein n=1 Tax=Maribacter sp. R77961 TaxID=3093871 RepID=UPI0037C8DED8